MKFVPLPERPDWKEKAEDCGFVFHSMHGEPYWVEDGAYAFSLDEVETQIEDPATELHAMCREAVEKVVRSEELMRKFGIPDEHRDLVAHSFTGGEAELYGRFDFIYDGVDPAKMIEYNADTPTSLFEAAAFQWSWLTDQIEAGILAEKADQFNLIFEAISQRFGEIFDPGTDIHFACLGDVTSNIEDYATVEALGYMAREAGMVPHFAELSGIGLTPEGQLADDQSRVMGALFKLYPWEDMLRDPFACHIATSGCRFLEPAWKALVSNKALLPLLWEMNEGHPNLLPAFFAGDVQDGHSGHDRAVRKGLFDAGTVSKPIFSREGASITISDRSGRPIESSGDRSYDRFPKILQAYRPMPEFNGKHPVLGVWMAGHAACGMGIREDASRITQDLSCFRPHFLTG